MPAFARSGTIRDPKGNVTPNAIHVGLLQDIPRTQTNPPIALSLRIGGGDTPGPLALGPSEARAAMAYR